MLDTNSSQTQQNLATRFRYCRRHSDNLVNNLSIEDHNLQAVAETSPLKWHLAHTTWFFETFLLKPYLKQYLPKSNAFEHLFNSYYNGVGTPFKRAKRHLLSRPSLQEVREYRSSVTEKVLALIGDENMSSEDRSTVIERLELGIQHEKQHQELMLTDIKFNFFQNPIYPAVFSETPKESAIAQLQKLTWHEQQQQLVSIGHNNQSFSFDNERPVHSVNLSGHSIAERLISNIEYIEFIEDNGYNRSELWLSDGWDFIQQNNIEAPLYWVNNGQQWLEFTLYGLVELNPNAAVCHLSYYEADAYARWCGARLATEFEWEHFANIRHSEKASRAVYHPQPSRLDSLHQEVWQWTQSSYLPYPGFKTSDGAIGEYNGKFMCNQMVLRGGSCFTPSDHIRNSYRNFFHPDARWQMSGIRLAKDAS